VARRHITTYQDVMGKPVMHQNLFSWVPFYDRRTVERPESISWSTSLLQ